MGCGQPETLCEITRPCAEPAPFGKHLHVVVGDASADAPLIAAALREARFTVHGVRPLAPSVEDVFIDRIAEADAA